MSKVDTSGWYCPVVAGPVENVHHRVADMLSAKAKAEISEMARRERERINRKFGQITRYTLARIELARRAR